MNEHDVRLEEIKKSCFDRYRKVLGIESDDYSLQIKIEREMAMFDAKEKTKQKLMEALQRTTRDDIPERFVGYVSYLTEDGTPCSVPLSLSKCGDEFYCMTDMTFSHSRYFVSNKYTYISYNNIQFKCEITFWGSTRVNNSLRLPDLIKRNYEDNWEKYGLLPNQVIFEFRAFEAKRWDYIDGIPFMSKIKWEPSHGSEDITFEEYKTMFTIDEE